MKRLVVYALERLCGVLDALPRIEREDGRWHAYGHGCWGCYPCGLAEKSMRLNDRWGLDVWTRREGQ